MPSDNNGKGSAFPSKEIKAPKNGKNKKSLGWIIGVIVLILISVTFILPTTVFSSNTAITFGRYNGKNIEFDYGNSSNYFYQQVESLSAANPMNSSNMMQIFAQAYYSTVTETALSEMADDASIRATDSMVNRSIMNSGYFADENGNYSPDVYRAASQLEKNVVRQFVQQTLPASMVLSDIIRVKTSDAEVDFVTGLNSNVRSFEYITLDYNLYPDADTAAYAEANAAPFTTADLSVITAATEEEASALLSSINAGETSFEESASASSTDSYAAEEGSMQSVMLFQLENMLVNAADAETVFSASVGAITGPVQGRSGWMLIRTNSETSPADTSDEETLDAIRGYIAANESETISSYLSTRTDELYQAAVSDFSKTAEENGLTVTSVGATSPNPGNSSFIIGLQYTDPYGLLSSAASADREFYSELFNAEENSVLAPRQAGSSWIIVRPVAASSSNDLLASYMRSFYTSYTPDLISMDLQHGILTSPDFQDDFYTVYFRDIMGVSTN